MAMLSASSNAASANSDAALRRALDAIHHLSDVRPSWPDALEGIRQVVGGDSATFIMFDGIGELLTLQQHNIDPTAEREYVNHYYAHDIVTPATTGAPRGTWFDTEELFSPTLLSKNAYYVDFMCRHNMRQMLTFIVDESPVAHGGLTVQRTTPARNERSHLESAKVRQLTDAVLDVMGKRRTESDQWLASADAAFSLLDEAICLVSDTGALIHLSPKANEWLESSAGLHARQGRLWHPVASMRDALQGALRRAAASPGITQLAMTGSRYGAGLQLDLARADARLRMGNESMVFVRMRRSRAPVPASAERLCMAFNLTPAEGRVLAALIDGESPADHARSYGTSIHTVRKQIAVLMEKIGCTRQIDLVRTGLGAL